MSAYGALEARFRRLGLLGGAGRDAALGLGDDDAARRR